MVSSVAPSEERRRTSRVQSYGWQAGFMFYAYILHSISHPAQVLRALPTRRSSELSNHNACRCPHTAKFVPWKLKFYAAFETQEGAQRFESYLKTGSGHAFAKRHLL